MPKNEWVDYAKGGDVIVIIIQDRTGAKIDKYKFNGRNSEDYGKVISLIKQKYGWVPKISFKENSWWY